jgi:hypothetical protein
MELRLLLRTTMAVLLYLTSTVSLPLTNTGRTHMDRNLILLLLEGNKEGNKEGNSLTATRLSPMQLLTRTLLHSQHLHRALTQKS